MSKKPRVLLVQGTHSYGRSTELQWWQCGSPFCEFLKAEGFEIIGAPPDEPYFWDTDLDGVGLFGRARRHASWIDAGDKLALYVRHLMRARRIRLADVNIIAHSHGLQPVAYACARFGLEINSLLSISSPPRADLRETYLAALPRIRRWRHVYSDGGDRLQWLGTLFDGHRGIVRKINLPGVLNVHVPRVAHSRLLNDARELLKINGDLDFLKGVTDYAPATHTVGS